MREIDTLKDKIASDFTKALKEFELYEKFYLSLSDNGKKYLKSQSTKYKQILSDIQKVILPSVKANCSTCNPNCCHLSLPELSIYMAGSVGGFCVADYLLVRCDTVLPTPYYDNAEKNRCPFYRNVCILPVDCRSCLCIQYFCDQIREELDMALVSKYLERAKSLLNNFSIGNCMM